MYVSCTKKIVETKYINNQESSGGGIDGSGGETVQSSKIEVENTLESIQKSAAESLFRLTLEYMFLSSETLDYIYGKNSANALSKLFKAKNFNATKVFNKLITQNVNLNVKDKGYCSTKLNGKIKHTHGSATGNFPHGSICLSINALQEIPKEGLRVQASALFIHELTHLFYLNEEDAKSIQNIIIKGRRYLSPLKSEQRELIVYAEGLLNMFNSRAVFDPEKNDTGTLCRSVNRAVTISDKLDALVKSSMNIDLNRRLPEYITLDIMTMANMIKGLRGYCNSSPLSTVASHNVQPGNNIDLSLKIESILVMVMTTHKRMNTYLDPLRNPKKIAQQIKDFDRYAKLPEKPKESSESKRKIPRHCYFNDIKKNLSYYPPKKGPTIKGEDATCLVSIKIKELNLTYYIMVPVPTYWIPGAKLPHILRKKAEKFFYKTVIELKIKDQLGDIIKHFLGYTYSEKAKKLGKLLSKVTWIPKSSKMGIGKTIKNNLLETLLDMEFNNFSANEQKAVIYYGLFQLRKMKLMSEGSKINTATNQLTKSFQLDSDYKTRYRLSLNQLERLNIKVFE